MTEPGSALRVRIESFARSRRLQPAFVSRWIAAADADASALLDLAESLRPSENQLRDILDWIEEIALRDGCSMESVLTSVPVRAALSQGLGRNETIKALRESLRRLRFPQLAAQEEQIARRIRALRLPRAARLILPDHLQDDEIRVELRARDAAALRSLAQSLGEAAGRPEMGEIFALLRELP